MNNELIYSVEDDENIRELINYALKDSGYNVYSFDNKKDFLNAVKKEIPSLVLLDIMLPDGDGVDILKEIRSSYSNVNIKIIMVTAKKNEMSIVNALNVGADDYITKPFSVLELIARVKANLRKKSVYIKDGGEIIFKNIKLVPVKRAVFLDGEEINLTNKEFELFYILLSNQGGVVSRETMLDKVWGKDSFIETRTIDMHIKSIREKLKLSKNSIISVRSIGYKFTGI